MKRRTLLGRPLAGALQNVSFRDLASLVEGFGFHLGRVTGSHHIFMHPAVREPIHLQRVHGEAKPYQIRQFLGLIERYNQTLEER